MSFRLFAFGLAAALSLTPLASPALALALGILLALTIGNPIPRASERAGQILLQLSVIGLGFGIPLGTVLKAGASGVGYTVLGVGFAVGLGLLLGRRLGVERETSLLISAGTGICGGSAIAALGPAIGARSEAMSVALGTVFVLNAVALYSFPPLGHLLQLTQHQFALWAALAIHDTSSVVGAAAAYGPAALAEATVLKLTRALWIIPIVLAASAAYRRPATATAVPPLPWFIGCFVLAALARTLSPPGLTPMLDGISHAARIGLVLTLFLIGTGLSRATLGAVGSRPLIQGVLLWACVSGVTLWCVWRWAGP